MYILSLIILLTALQFFILLTLTKGEICARNEVMLRKKVLRRPSDKAARAYLRALRRLDIPALPQKVRARQLFTLSVLLSSGEIAPATKRLLLDFYKNADF